MILKRKREKRNKKFKRKERMKRKWIHFVANPPNANVVVLAEGAAVEVAHEVGLEAIPRDSRPRSRNIN